MEAARAIIKKRTPYISTTLYELIPFEKKGLLKKTKTPILTTRRMVMAYDPDWFETLTDEEAAGVVFHETQHPMRRHFSRGDSYLDHDKFNIAGDLGINDDAREAGYTLPHGVVYPETYKLAKGLSAEEYYDLLPDPPEKPQGPGGGGPAAAGGGEGEGEPDPKIPPCAGNCGGAAGNDQEGEDELDGEVEAESPGATKSEAAVASMLKQQAKEISDFVAANGRGSIPNHLVEWAKFQLAPPKVHWKRQLPRVLRRSLGRITQGGENYSKKRISKRSFVRGRVIPGLISQKPEVVIIRDTSGSMGSQQLQDVQNEVIGVFKAAGFESVMFMDADADANKPRRVNVKDIPKLPITGRGGTDFGPAIAVASKLKPRPQLIMYFTDGDGPAPARQPFGIEFIWVIISSYYNKAPASWGHRIFVGPDGGVADEDDDY
jgi:predicted metal-dependent peptidase